MRYFIIISLVVFSTVFADEKSRTIEYKKINSLLSFLKQNTHSPYIAVDQHINISAKDITFTDVKIWLSTTGSKLLQEVSIDSEGKLDLPLLSEDTANKTTLNISQQKDAVSIAISTGIVAPQQKDLSYTDLFVLLDDTNNFISEMGGAAAWFAPDMDVLSFKFEQPAKIIITTIKKEYTYTTDDEYNIDIKVNKRLMKENPRVIFSDLPIDMTAKD